MERMLAYPTGMIGFPLRLLARENYERAVRMKGSNAVALITGEEKILPLGARYFVCTAESMPVDRVVDFLAVDEIQMCADPDRGHVFTDRLLNARGTEETMFLGAATMRPLIRKLVPEAEFMSRPRFSSLTFTGAKKTSRLPKRSAIVAFSAGDVYAIAELVRRQRGGAAIVMGVLSPRTRNAQVEMYQSGEVDYLVATDAIGMGLNMDVDHVAFAATRKFDGRYRRELAAAELAQIAGRAGRHMNDGTFGTTGDTGPLEAEVVARIENHEFEPLRRIQWRNPKPAFSSLNDLLASLAVPPELAGLAKARRADDELVLRQLADDPDIAGLAHGYERVKLLWEVCQIPDFGNVMSHGHAQLLAALYRHLTQGVRQIPGDWMADRVARLDRTDGDIEHLTGRIAGIRTWTYVSFRSDWLADAREWRERTRSIEDKLSDALHDRLTQRFVDKRTVQLAKKLKEEPQLLSAVKADGDVLVEGHFVGHLHGFRFHADENARGSGGAGATRTVLQAASRALRGEIASRVKAFEKEPDEAIVLETDDAGRPTRNVTWRGDPIARLVKGAAPLKPGIEPLASELLVPVARDRVAKRLQAWIDNRVEESLAPLFRLQGAALSGPARGIAFQIGENLGSLRRSRAGNEIAALTRADRKALKGAGVRIGRESLFVPDLLKPQGVSWRGLLWALFTDGAVPAPVPAPGRVCIEPEPGVADTFYDAIGYRHLGPVVLRLDMVERVAGKAWALNSRGPFVIGHELMSLAGCGVEGAAAVLRALGYRRVKSEGEERYQFRGQAKRRAKDGGRRVRKDKEKPEKSGSGKKADGHSPFHVLKTMELGR